VQDAKGKSGLPAEGALSVYACKVFGLKERKLDPKPFTVYLGNLWFVSLSRPGFVPSASSFFTCVLRS